MNEIKTNTDFPSELTHFSTKQNNNNNKTVHNIMQINNYLHFKCEFVFYHENQFESNYLPFLLLFIMLILCSSSFSANPYPNTQKKINKFSRKWHTQLMLMLFVAVIGCSLANTWQIKIEQIYYTIFSGFEYKTTTNNASNVTYDNVLRVNFYNALFCTFLLLLCMKLKMQRQWQLTFLINYSFVQQTIKQLLFAFS